MTKEYSEYSSVEASREASPSPSPKKYKKEVKKDELFVMIFIIALSVLFENFGLVFSIIFVFIKPKLAAVSFSTYLFSHFIPQLFAAWYINYVFGDLIKAFSNIFS